MQDDQTGSFGGQLPAQQQQQQTRQREQQAGDVPTTLYDIDLRDIRLGVNVPALSYNAQGWLARCSMANVLRRPEGCTIEALVVDPDVCCNSYESVQAVQRLPWWWLAMQMRSLVRAGTLTLGHWHNSNFFERWPYNEIGFVLDQLLQNAVNHGIVTAELTPLKQLNADNRNLNAREKLAVYLKDVANQRLFKEQNRTAQDRERARLAEERAAEDRARLLTLQAELAALRLSSAQHAAPPAVPAVTTQPRQLLPLDLYGQECQQLLSADVGRALYDSVYNATWGALQYSTDENTNGRITYAERETALPVTLDDQGIEVAVGDRMHAAQHADGIAMLTLYSQRGWPTSWAFGLSSAENSPVNVPVPQQKEQSRDPDVIDDAEHDKLLYVRYEVQRAWRHVARFYNEHNRNAKLSTLPLGHVPPATTPTQRVDGVRVGLFVLGTPGIGKTMSGNYMLYRLLHDVNAPPYIAFAVGKRVYIFDKRHRVVSRYKRDDFDRDAFSEWCGTQCVYIHDCGKEKYKLDQDDGPREALLLALSSPNKANYDKALNKPGIGARARAIVVNSWSYRELCCVAPLVGVDLDTLRERVVHVGPLPRHVYDADSFDNRMVAVARAVGVRAAELQKRSGIVAVDNTTRGENYEHPTNALYDMYRVRSGERQQDDNDVPTRSDKWQFRLFAEKIPSMLLSKLMCHYLSDMFKILDASVYLSTSTASYEMHVKVAITLRLFWRGVHTANNIDGSARFHRCLRPGTRPLLEPALVPLTAADIQHWTQGAPDMLNARAVGKNEAIAFGASDTAVVYMPESAAFALIDAFLLVRESAAKVHFVGIQATTAENHPVTHSQLEYFVRDMPAMRIAVAAPQTQANEQQPQQVTTAQPAAQATTSAQATDAAGKEDAAAARVAKLGRLRESIATWSVVYVGASLRDSNMFEVQPDPPQKRKEALAATGAQQHTDAHSDASQPRARRAASSTPAAHVGSTAQRQTDPGNTAEQAQQAQVHANDAADPYIAFWNEVTRYIYKASTQHLKDVKDESLAAYIKRQKRAQKKISKQAEQKQREQDAENEDDEHEQRQKPTTCTTSTTITEKSLQRDDDDDE